MNDDYAVFLARKSVRATERGLATVPPLASHLFPFQEHCVSFALRGGATGLFLDTGLGKTECQLEWCQKVIEDTGRPALILTPLAVAQQTRRRAERWGYEARVIKSQADVGRGINIINYDRLDKIDPSAFGAVSLDEASILKSFDGKIRGRIIEAFKRAPFKLAATATPAPNDIMELGSYSEFLDVMSTQEMLSRFFINDTSTASQQWRLKRYGVSAFWAWMASWTRMAEKPSDMGFDDDGFLLPPFEFVRHKSRNSDIDRSLSDMFGVPSLSATDIHTVKRQTSAARAEAAAAIIASEPGMPWIIWVDTNYEADAVTAVIPDACEVRGSQSTDEKESKLEAFATGNTRILIGKPTMIGFGSDWSHCCRMVFLGRSFSYETWYQAVRRCWRFGQKNKVIVHLIVAEGEDEIGRVIDRKSGDHAKMKTAVRAAMKNDGMAHVTRVSYQPHHIAELEQWMSAV